MKNVQIAHGLSKAADRLGQTSDIAVNERRSSRRWSAASSSEDGDAPRRPSRSMSILKSAGELLSAGLSVSGPASDQDLSLLNPESPQGAEKEEVAPVVAAAQAPMQILEEEATLDDAALENDRVLRSLKKPPSSRTDEDLQVIKQATADVKFFERLSTEEHHELCRVIEHTYLPKGHTIFEQGDEGSTFYIIYMGAAKVYVAYATAAPAAHQTDPKPLRSLESFNHPFSAFESDATSSLGRSAAGAPAAAAPPAAAQPLHKLGTCVCLLEDGDSFGELALMGNGVRQASIETAMDTHLLKIDKDVYEQSLHKLHEAELQLRMEFLRGVFIFSDWSDEDLRRISYVMTSRRYEKNKTIIAQGDHTDSIFFLKEGGCRVLKRMQISQRQQAPTRTPRAQMHVPSACVICAMCCSLPGNARRPVPARRRPQVPASNAKGRGAARDRRPRRPTVLWRARNARQEGTLGLSRERVASGGAHLVQVRLLPPG
jgi:CRP-like cAMP-binding protein